jgi:sec-independent protein translocase protein TatA
MLIGHLPELLLVLILALVFVGPGKLPMLGDALGKSIAQFRRATNEVEASLTSTLDETPALEQASREERHLS